MDVSEHQLGTHVGFRLTPSTDRMSLNNTAIPPLLELRSRADTGTADREPAAQHKGLLDGSPHPSLTFRTPHHPRRLSSQRFRSTVFPRGLHDLYRKSVIVDHISPVAVPLIRHVFAASTTPVPTHVAAAWSRSSLSPLRSSQLAWLYRARSQS